MFIELFSKSKKNQESRSLKKHLFVIILCMGILACFLSSYGFLTIRRSDILTTSTNDLEKQVVVLGNHLSSCAYENLNDGRTEMALMTDLTGVRLLLVDSGYQVRLDSNSVLEDRYIINQAITKALEEDSFSVVNEKAGYIEVAKKITLYGTQDAVLYGILSTEIVLKGSGHPVVMLFAMQLVLIAGIALISYIIAGVVSKRLSKLAKTIENVASFEEGDIVSVGYSETDGIVRAFNAQRTRLKALDDSRQEFVSNVSHELKTPIASIKVLAESLIFQENAPIEMYRDFMQDIVEEIDRENSIITDLLALVHMEQGKENLNVTDVDCNAMLELIIKRLTPIAAQNDVDIVFDTEVNVIACIDEVKMTLAITNLVENAIKYNNHPGWVRILLDADNQMFTVTISDSGIGISEEALPHIYERFYRVDKSHSKEIGGTGLGLPLARKIILLHRGSITVNSVPGEGTDFVVRIPLDYVV